MKKGTSAFRNLALLKFCSMYDIAPRATVTTKSKAFHFESVRLPEMRNQSIRPRYANLKKTIEEAPKFLTS
jgi:hypothetical protein